MAMSVVYTTINGVLYHENRGGVETEYVPDTLGSLIGCRDSSGNVTYTADYWPYGEVRTSTGSKSSPWGFVGLLGYLTDLAKRLYVRARHYRPNIGQWQTVDPLWPKEPAYRYALNQPIWMTDPSGQIPLWQEIPCCIWRAGLGTVLGCLVGLTGACATCVYAALAGCAATPETCPFLLYGCALGLCGWSAINCVLTGLGGMLLMLINCIRSGECQDPPTPPPMPGSFDDCIDRCKIFAPGRQHQECMFNCRGVPLPRGKPCKPTPAPIGPPGVWV